MSTRSSGIISKKKKDAPLPLSRTKSTPLATTTTRSNTSVALDSVTPSSSTSSSNNNNHSLSYALRRVFSTDPSQQQQQPKDYNEEETQDLLFPFHNQEKNDNNIIRNGSQHQQLALSRRVSSHVLEHDMEHPKGSGHDDENEVGAELILDHYPNANNDEDEEHYDDMDLSQSNISVANAMLEERKLQKQLSKGGSYPLRKFLSTPLHTTKTTTIATNNNDNVTNRITSSASTHHRRNASSVMNTIREGQKTMGGIPQSYASSRRVPSYDNSRQGLTFDDAEFHDNQSYPTFTDKSPLFQSPNGGGDTNIDGVEVSLSDHSYTHPNDASFNPIPFSRNPLSFRRKNSELSPKFKMKGNEEDSDKHDDMSTVAESTAESSSITALFDHDIMKKKISSPWRHGLLLSLRRHPRVLPVLMMLVVCLICGVVVVLTGFAKRRGGGSNGLEKNSMAFNHLEVVASMKENEDGVVFGSGTKNSDVSYEGDMDTDFNGGVNFVNNSVNNPVNKETGTNSGGKPIGGHISSNIVTPSVNMEEVANTIVPTYSPTSETYTKFYVMADCPYDDNERNNLMPGYIENLSSDAAFLIHLGDMQYAKDDQCEEWAYQVASSIIKKSPIPAFVLPGDNDMNDCPDHEHGEDMWKQYFHKIDEYWEHNFALTRWGKFDESFSFVSKGVLYFGLNVVGGDPYSASEAEIRYALHLENIRSIINGLGEEDYKVIVLFAHADPSYVSTHEEFFEEFAEIIEKVGKPTVHFNGDYHEYYEKEGGDYNVKNYLRISLDGESIAPPIRVEIDVSKKNPITVSRRREDLYVDCCSDGWPLGVEEL